MGTNQKTYNQTFTIEFKRNASLKDSIDEMLKQMNKKGYKLFNLEPLSLDLPGSKTIKHIMFFGEKVENAQDYNQAFEIVCAPNESLTLLDLSRKMIHDMDKMGFKLMNLDPLSQMKNGIRHIIYFAEKIED